MFNFRPLEKLPSIGDGAEHETWDLKQHLNPKKPFEAAKDVAALANHLGGKILVGAREENERIAEYTGLTEALAIEQRRFLEDAIKRRCEPKPSFAVRPLSCSIATKGDTVLAITVAPFLNGLVGVTTADNLRADGAPWVFPVRLGAGTGYYSPEQLPMYLLPEVRRKVILLRHAQASNDPIRLRRLDGGSRDGQWRVQHIEEDHNAVTFVDSIRSHQKEHVGLDQITTVFKQGESWTVFYHPILR